MISSTFKILEVNLSSGRSTIRSLPGVATYLGGSGLAAKLHLDYAKPELAWVGGLGVEASLACASGEAGVLPRWEEGWRVLITDVVRGWP